MRPALVAVLLLLIPLLGNLLVDGWNWPPQAFVLFGAIFFGLGLVYQLATRNGAAAAYRVAVGLSLAAAFLLFWGNFVQAADDVNPNALMYLVVPLVGIVCAAIARLRPAAMAKALFVTALVQALVLMTLLMTRDPQVLPWTPAVLRGFGGNAFFVIVLIGAALLFRTAAREQSAPDQVYKDH